MNFSIPDDALTLALAAAAGLIIGSFLNVVIHRGPAMWGLIDGASRGDLVSPASYCLSCKTPIPPWRLIPVVSFVIQRGRCAACGEPVAPRYPIVEALGAVVALSSVAAFGATAAAVAAASFGLALVALAFIDLETGYLPDAITFPLIVGGLIANGFDQFVPIGDALIGAVAGYLAFRGIGFAFNRLRGKEGLGQGDAKLLAAIGAWGGWMILPFVVFAGALATLFAYGATRQRRPKIRIKPPSSPSPPSRGEKDGADGRDAPIPFGPGLSAAGFIVLLLAPRLFTVL